MAGSSIDGLGMSSGATINDVHCCCYYDEIAVQTVNVRIKLIQGIHHEVSCPLEVVPKRVFLVLGQVE